MKHWKWGSRDERIRIWIGVEASERSDGDDGCRWGSIVVIRPSAVTSSIVAHQVLSLLNFPRAEIPSLAIITPPHPIIMQPFSLLYSFDT
ncbi:MAG: hypothetical protein CL912_13365 [Deltaproteobacteria bacterium]|nr:hypothetical protein [Deltaproteobacteria bacterium]